MTAPNTQTTPLVQQIASSPDGYVMLPLAYRRSNPSQTSIATTQTGVLTTYSGNNGANSAVASNYTAVITFAAANGGNGAGANEMILAVSTTATANVAIAGAWSSAANTFQVIQSNPSGTSANNTANTTYLFTTSNNQNVFALPANTSAGGAVGTPAVPANGVIVEQTYTFNPSNATGTAYINSNTGQVIGVAVNTQGSFYFEPPTVMFSGGNGTGATGICQVANGGVVSVQVTGGGSGYTSAPSVSFTGGGMIAPGMYASAMRTQANVAGLCIGNVRVAGANQIAVQFYNLTSSAIGANINDTYSFCALNSTPSISPMVTVTANISAANATGANAANFTVANINNLTSTDQVLSWNAAAAGAYSQAAGSNCAANNLTFAYFGGATATTPAAGTFTFNVLKNQALPPVQIYNVLLTPAAVKANSVASQTFAMPAGFIGPANVTVGVNKPSLTTGIAIGGAAIINANANIGINFVNTTAANITPPAEVYTIAVFNAYNPVLGGAIANAGTCAQIVSMSYSQNMNLTNELQNTMVANGMIYGG